MAEEPHQLDPASFAAGQQVEQLRNLIATMSEVKKGQEDMRSELSDVSKQVIKINATIDPITKLFWTLILAVLAAIGTSAWSLIAHK